MSSEQEQTEGSSRSTDTTQPVHGGGNSASVDQVFSMFKDYLEKKLEVKTKQIEQKSKIDKEVVQLKYKGNQMQYELNAELDSIIESIETESERGEPNLPLIKKYSQEARELIRKRQKLIKIADKSKDGWQVGQSTNPMSWRPTLKMRNGSKRLEKRRVERDDKKTNSQAGAERKQEPLWVLIISFFVVRKIAYNLLCDFIWFWIRLHILPYCLFDLFITGI